MSLAKGVLPRQRNTNQDRVIRNPHANGYFISVDLVDPLTREQVAAWLTNVAKPAVEQLVAHPHGHELDLGHDASERLAAVAIGFGERFFNRAFDPPIAMPLDFANRPRRLPNATHPDDIIFYVVALSEARAADFLATLSSDRSTVANVRLHRGYQRIDESEVFGYRDGIRNPRAAEERQRIAFVEGDSGEPEWSHGGTYMVYMRIQQNHETFDALADDNARDAVIGRTSDGRRLDQAEVDFPNEPSEYGSGMPPNSHVRKAGPRGKHEDVKIFRRGLPYVEANDSGQVTRGLNFVSFQKSLDPFDVIFNDWMRDTRFPEQQSEIGQDALLAHTTTIKEGAYFVPPHDDDFPGATMFRAAAVKQPKTGKIHIRKTVRDVNNSPRGFERSGFVFELVANDGTGTVLQTQSTNAVGHATFDDVPLGVYEVREQPPMIANMQPAPNQTINLDSGAVVLRFENVQNDPNSPYG
ncbi:MAG: Dyp-type peroxidase family [Thermoleophilia bacterium]|nr:Dyp-type peroxidase family [Thermoleophilia bacterium]